MKRPTIKDVAGHAGVSTATVSHVVNDTKFVSVDTRQRVLASIRELNYRPSGVASSLRRRSSRILGVVLPMQEQDTSAVFFSQLAAGIESAVSARGYRTIISNTVEDSARQREQLQILSGQFVDYIDGLVLAPAAGDVAEFESAVAAQSVPVVYVDRLPRGHTGDVDFVGTDNYAISVAGLNALLERGGRDIVCISSPIDVSSMAARRAAFLDVASTLHADAEDRIVITRSSHEEGYRAGLEALTRFPDLDTLFITNNTVAMGVVRALQEKRGFEARDVALLVYDNFEWMNLIQPVMDSVEQPAFAMGEAAGRLLLDRIDDPDDTPRTEILPSRLVWRTPKGEPNNLSQPKPQPNLTRES